MSKFKLKMTKSLTTKEDILTLIDFLIVEGKAEIKN